MLIRSGESIQFTTKYFVGCKFFIPALYEVEEVLLFLVYIINGE